MQEMLIKNGSGISSEEFNLGKMKHYLMFHHNTINHSYHDWVTADGGNVD